ncbi:LysR substrate-binding domain-containing protein [Methylovirgula sp. 4M-Z18]|uniref:LysR substrate-binding domain-containing protein n=1 Tax=Methylovirgula sp. 4M-Z18 TaxID=2293567 RepID=UPI000E2EFAF5|nr:LysR substrate-binding domain-containing protein [Methylovirgula sp. 4M-Z18]RFB80513.1 LysR family transcriptional regulator [Methylovirgula sp. 4M-Z18]
MASAPSLRGLQAFEAAARSGSFVAASEELAVSAAAISQLIRALEDQVGRKLFHRINRRAVLTEAGVEIFPRLAGAFNELRNVSRELSGGEQRSTLVVSVAPSVAMGWLSSRLSGFIDSHGPVDISLRGEDDPVPFDRDLIDIRLSYGGSHYLEHVTEELVTDAVYPVCSPDFLTRYGPIASPAHLHSVPLIHTDWGPSSASFPSWRNWFEAANLTPGRHIQHGMTANSSMAALDLARAGLGVVLAQGIFCARQVEDGELVVAVNHVLELGNPYCITIPRRSTQRSVVAAFKTWFAAECIRSVKSPATASFR